MHLFFKLPRCAGTEEQRAFLRRLYAKLNRRRFRGRLPHEVSLRLSTRMTQRFGHVRYHVRRSGERTILELALNIDLLLAGNERELLDTMLHEMAHIEAWLVHGHRGHGEPWQRVAARVRCDVGACTCKRIRQRPDTSYRVTRVPVVRRVLLAA